MHSPRYLGVHQGKHTPFSLCGVLPTILKVAHDGLDSARVKGLGLVACVVADGVVDVGPIKAADQHERVVEVQLLDHVLPDLSASQAVDAGCSQSAEFDVSKLA